MTYNDASFILSLVLLACLGYLGWVLVYYVRAYRRAFRREPDLPPVTDGRYR